jgi:hypothetical protein
MKSVKFLPAVFIFFAFVQAGCRKDHFAETLVSPVKKTDFIVAGDNGAGISYYDLIPDWEKHGFGLINDSISIDINNDSIVDASFHYITIVSGSEYDQQTSVNCYNGAEISIAPKNAGDTIHSSSGWSAIGALLCFTKINFASSDTTYSGPWNGVDDHYIGIKVTKNRHVLYGWIRISVLVPPAIVYVQQIIVKEFACRKLE